MLDELRTSPDAEVKVRTDLAAAVRMDRHRG